MKSAIAVAICSAVLMAQLTVTANASGMSFARAGMRHCGGDVSRLCSNVFPGGGRIAQCLLDNAERLSPACHAFVGEAKAARQIMFACQPDAERFCTDVEPGRGRIVRCLDRKRDVISRPCERALNRAESMLAQ